MEGRVKVRWMVGLVGRVIALGIFVVDCLCSFCLFKPRDLRIINHIFIRPSLLCFYIKNSKKTHASKKWLVPPCGKSFWHWYLIQLTVFVTSSDLCPTKANKKCHRDQFLDHSFQPLLMPNLSKINILSQPLASHPVKCFQCTCNVLEQIT